METLTTVLIGVTAALGLVSLAAGGFVCKAPTDTQHAGDPGVSTERRSTRPGTSEPGRGRWLMAEPRR